MPTHLSRILAVLAVLALGLRLLQSAQVTGAVSSHYGVVFGMPRAYASMDVAQALRTVKRSSWLVHNGYKQYGPLYFRSAWTLEKLDPVLSRGSDAKWGQARDRHYHASLLLVNLLAFTGLCWLISSMLTPHRVERLIGTLVMMTALQFSDIWCWGLLTAKPETFICLLSAAGALWAWRMFEDDAASWRPLILTALFFGLAMSTKLSTLVYLAILPLCFLPRLQLRARGLERWPIHKRILPGLAFLAIVFVVYLATGWPQNADFPRLFPYMKFMSMQNNAPVGTMPDMEWGRRVAEQTLPALAGVCLLALAWREPSRSPRSAWTVARALVFAAFPIAYMCTKNVASPSEHYLMQFIASGLIMVAGTLGVLWPRSPRAAAPGPRLCLNAALLALACGLPFVAPHRWGPVSQDMLQAKQEAQERFDLVRQLQETHRHVYVDPYVSHDPNLGRLHWTYRANDGLFRDEGPVVMVLNPDFYRRYLADPPDYYVQVFWRGSWPATRAFYQRFAGQDRVTDPLGHAWVLQRQLGLDIWFRQP